MNTYVDALTMEETVLRVEEIIAKGIPTQHVAINALKINLIENNPEIRQIVRSCGLISADGMSILWSAKFLGVPIHDRVTGCDLFSELVRVAWEKHYRIFLFGAKEEVVCRVREIFERTYPGIRIVGTHSGYFREDEEEHIADVIADSHADMAFVALSSPKQEYYIHTYLSRMKVPFVMGVGGSFDVVAGVAKRAPVWIQKIGLEWFYRFLQEPRARFRRCFIDNSRFIGLMLRYKFKPYTDEYQERLTW